MNSKKIMALLAIVWLSLSAQTQSAEQEKEKVTLRIMHFLPAVANAQKNVLEPWCADLAEQSGDRIECQIYPSMQLGGTPAQLADMARNGVVDIVWTGLGYAAGRFPRSEALELPFVMPSGGVDGSEVAWEFYQRYAKDDFRDYHVLAIQSDGGGTLHTARRKVASLDDMKGLRVRASTRLASELLTSLGATPVSMPPAQIADTLAKGVIDGALAVWEVVPPTKLDETTHYHMRTAPDQATPTVTTLAVLMNKKRYQNLPDDLRAIIDRFSGEALSRRFGEAWDVTIDQVVEQLSADPDHEIVTLDDATYQSMREASQRVTDEWVASDKGGIDRQALYQGLRDIVREHAAR